MEREQEFDAPRREALQAMNDIPDNRPNVSILKAKQAKYFDELVDLFDQEQPPQIQANLRQIVVSAAIREGDSVLDVGAGVGVLIPLIEKYNPARVVACEISARMLERLKMKFPNVETYLSDIAELPLPDRSIDVIFMNAVFPNLHEKPKALSNCCRMLAPNGRIIISHPEGRLFVENLREVVPFPLDPLPTFPELRRIIKGLPLALTFYQDTSNLYLAVLDRTPLDPKKPLGKR